MTVRNLFNIIISILIVLSGISYFVFIKFTDAMENKQGALDYRYAALLLSNEMAADSAGLTNNIRLYGATGNPKYRAEYMFILDSSAGKVPRKDGTTISFDQKVANMGVTPDEKQALTNAKKLSNGLAVIEVEVMDTIDSYVKKHGTGDDYLANMDDKLRDQLIRLYNDEYYVWIDQIAEQVKTFNRLLFRRVDENIKETTATSSFYQSLFSFVLAVLVLSTLGLILFAMHFLNTRLGGPPKELAETAERIADGDLDIELKIKEGDTNSLFYSIGRMVNTLKKNINEISIKTAEAESKSLAAEQALQEAQEAKHAADRAKAEGLLDAANRLSAVVERIADIGSDIENQANEIRHGTEEQNTRVLSTVTAMEQMNATVLEVAKNSSEAAEVGKEAQSKAQEGMSVVEESVSAMEVTKNQAEELKDDMEKLGGQAESIGTILNVISDIADQTNLLALNAAIEAARAGDAGRGFAVVADEVRKLAEKTMSATTEVGEAISAIQNSTRQNIQSMDKAVDHIANASSLTSRSGEALGVILEKVEISAIQVQEIATAAEEQSATSEEINSALSEINRITDENARGVNQTTEALTQLTGLIDELTSLVAELEEEGHRN